MRTPAAAMFMTDGYKLDHRRQYPKGTEFVYANWTPRGSRIDGVDEVIFVGLQYAIKKRLMEDFEAFFTADVDEVCADYQRLLDSYLGPTQIGTDHIRALHNLGYLPLEFKALPEGTKVPLRVPMFTVENTHPEFFWLTNYFETVLSAELWMPMTSATNAGRVRTLLDSYARFTGSQFPVGFQGHDFSMRGMAGADAANLSGLGHLVAFTGTETVPVLDFIRHYYPGNPDYFLAATVPATEHSVMCAGGSESEKETFARIALELYPTGIVSIVSDTWDFWNVITDILPSLKDEIMERDGKVVVRPDSGDPADIICGTKLHYADAKTNEEKGAIQLLWETFGGTVNEKGMRVLDPHVGLIYGDAMNYERIDDICNRLAMKNFSIDPLVFGMGSFGYQYQTRDTFGFAMKATNVVINGEETAIFKDPKTDDGLKKSLKGRISVQRYEDRGLVAHDEVTPGSPLDYTNLLTTIWKDGKFVRTYSFEEVRNNAGLVN